MWFHYEFKNLPAGQPISSDDLLLHQSYAGTMAKLSFSPNAMKFKCARIGQVVH